jgi:hypothetical protein
VVNAPFDIQVTVQKSYIQERKRDMHGHTHCDVQKDPKHHQPGALTEIQLFKLIDVD